MADSFADTMAGLGVRDDLGQSLDATIGPHSALTSTEHDLSALPGLSLRFPGDPKGARVPASDRELEVVSLIGEGGMGAIYLAHQRSLGRDVAIKTTRIDAGEEAVQALCAEALVTGRLEHPGIVPVHQIGRAPDGRPVLVMKRVEGTNWRVLLREPAHPGWAALRVATEADRAAFHLEVLRRVCDALAFAHSRGIVHRDVKPENVMLGAFGEVYLVDWGLATKNGERRPPGMLLGTPVYMAPEMVDGRAVDARTDVYLLGATLHEILTGRPPHRGTTISEALHDAWLSPVREYGPEVPPELAVLCRRAMTRDPEERPRDAAAVRDAIVEFERHRASRALTRRADERLADLRVRVAEPFAEGEVPALYRLVNECRFAYLEAQREWDQNEAVRPGLTGCAEAAVAIELARRDAAAARALLQEVPGDSPLFARVAALEDAVAGERAESERVQMLAETADANVGPRGRWVMTLMASMGIMLILIGALFRRTPQPDVVELILYALGLTAVIGVGALAGGQEIFRHTFNRRILISALLLMAAVTLDRVLALVTQIPVPVLLVHDQLLIALAFSIGAVWTFRLMAVIGVLFAASSVAAALKPESAFTSLLVANTLSVFAFVIAVARSGRGVRR
jgi:serine/threonine-protein kinase